MTERIRTHSEECWRWHLDCALRKIAELHDRLEMWPVNPETRETLYDEEMLLT